MTDNNLSANGFDAGLPLNPGANKNPFEPTFNVIGAPLNPLDGSRSTDVASLGSQSGQTVDPLTGIPSSDSGGILSSLLPPDPVYGDEFRSGFLPIDIAAHQMGTAMDKVETAGAAAIAAVVNEVSETAQTFIAEARKSWDSPDNKLHQNLNSGIEKSITQVRNWFDRFSNDPKVKEAVEQLGEKTGETLYNVRRGLESLQDKAEGLVDRIHGQSGFVNARDQLATGVGSGIGSEDLTAKQPDLTSAAYTTDNIYSQSGYAPESVSSNSILGAAKGNCTWYANGRAEELGADPKLLDVMNGNAFGWDDEARAAGIIISNRPQPGMVAIAQWEDGHVAVVESVNNDGTITISESSYDPGGKADYLYNTRTISADKPDRFILIPKVSADVTPSANASVVATSSAVDEKSGVGAAGVSGNQNDQAISYTVKGGDTLSQIAQDLTGSAANYQQIADYNGIVNPDAIGEGQVIRIPRTLLSGSSQDTTVNANSTSANTSMVATSDNGTDRKTVVGTTGTDNIGEQVAIGNQNFRWVPYTVKSGETLSKISQDSTGSATNDRLIAEHNNIANPDLVRVDQTIKIPQALAIDDKSVSHQENMTTENGQGDNLTNNITIVDPKAPKINFPENTRSFADDKSLGLHQITGDSERANSVQKTLESIRNIDNTIYKVPKTVFTEKALFDVAKDPKQYGIHDFFGGNREEITFSEYLEMKLKLKAQNDAYGKLADFTNQDLQKYIQQLQQDAEFGGRSLAEKISHRLQEQEESVRKYQEAERRAADFTVGGVLDKLNPLNPSFSERAKYALRETSNSYDEFLGGAAKNGFKLATSWIPKLNTLKEAFFDTDFGDGKKALVSSGIQYGSLATSIWTLLKDFSESYENLEKGLKEGKIDEIARSFNAFLEASSKIGKEFVKFLGSEDVKKLAIPEVLALASTVNTLVEISSIKDRPEVLRELDDFDKSYLSATQISSLAETLTGFVNLAIAEIKNRVGSESELRSQLKLLQQNVDKLDSIRGILYDSFEFSYKQEKRLAYDNMRTRFQYREKIYRSLTDTIDSSAQEIGQYLLKTRSDSLMIKSDSGIERIVNSPPQKLVR